MIKSIVRNLLFSGGVRVGLLANLSGSLWMALLALLFIPIYVNLLGVEAYGLVGVFFTLQALVVVCDLGLGTSLNRELARRTRGGVLEGDGQALIKTVETLYWLGAITIFVAVFSAAPLVSESWLRRETLPADLVTTAIRLMAGAIALQFPYTLYVGGLLGLQKHVRLNVIIVIFGTLRWGGAALVLWLWETSVLRFLEWQVLISAIQSLVLGFMLHLTAESSPFRRQFQWSTLTGMSRFASGLALITVTGALLPQVDKVILTRFVTLETFGYYSVASVLAAGLVLFSNPVFSTMLPKLSQLHEQGASAELSGLYRKATQVLAALILPVSIVLIFFSHEVLLIWTRDNDVAVNAGPVLTILTIGFAAHALVYLPYTLQLAEGWVSLPARLNLGGLMLLIPAEVAGAKYFGAMGAAIGWALFTCTYLFISVWIMHRRLLRGYAPRWFLRDVGLPLLGSLIVVLPARMIWNVLDTPVRPAYGLILVAGLVLLASGLMTPAMRDVFRESPKTIGK